MWSSSRSSPPGSRAWAGARGIGGLIRSAGADEPVAARSLLALLDSWEDTSRRREVLSFGHSCNYRSCTQAQSAKAGAPAVVGYPVARSNGDARHGIPQGRVRRRRGGAQHAGRPHNWAIAGGQNHPGLPPRVDPAMPVIAKWPPIRGL